MEVMNEIEVVVVITKGVYAIAEVGDIGILEPYTRHSDIYPYRITSTDDGYSNVFKEYEFELLSIL